MFKKIKSAYKKVRDIIQRKGISFSLSGYTGGLALNWSGFNTQNAFNTYKELAWIYACVHLRASAVASVPWLVEKKTGDDWEVDKNHELNALINRPNRRIDRSTMFKFSLQHLDLQGNAYWIKVRRSENTGSVMELWPTPPGQITPILNNGIIQRYQKKNGGTYEIKDIVHLMYTNPESLYIGISPLRAAMKAVDIDKDAQDYQKNSFKNRGIPDGVFTIEDIQSKEQYELAKEQIKAQYGGVNNARTPMVVGGKAKWSAMSLSSAEMDFIQSRKMTREEILAVYGVPHPMVGVYDKATLANIQTARQIFWRDTMIPVLSEIESELNLQLAWEEHGDGIRFRYDVSNIEAMRDSYTESVTNARQLWSMGVSFNDINKRLELGFDELEGGDVGYIPGGLIPNDMDFLTTENLENSKDLAKLAYGKD